MNTAALIILSGRTSWKDGFQPGHRTGALSDACRLVLTFSRAGVSPVVVVPCPEELAAKKELSKLGAILLGGDQGPQAEMFDHVRTGLRYLGGQCDRAFVTPVDIPLVRADTVRALATSPHLWTVPEYRGRAGHPVLVGGELFADVVEYGGGEGLRGALKMAGHTARRFAVDDEGVVLDVDTADRVDEAVENHDLRKLRPDIRVCLCRERAFWGPGTRQLLSLIDKLGSVSEASQQMGLSYSKAWKIIKILEEELQVSAVVRQQGGKNGGEAHLTPRGRELLAAFAAYEQECKQAAEEIFRRHFPQE